MPRTIFFHTLLAIAALTISVILQAQNETTRIGILGCHKQRRPAPALEYYANIAQPDICVWVGDNVYADTKQDPAHIVSAIQHDKLQALAFAKVKYFGIEVEYLGYIEYDDTVRLSSRHRRPLMIEYPSSSAARCVEKISQNLL